MRIAIDPGHGKAGSGAKGRIDETERAWKLAGALASALRLLGMEPFLTRAQNEKPSLEERAKHAEKYGCCALVSIHFNAGGGDGVEVYPQFFGDKTICGISRRIAESIIAKMTAAGQQSRGVKCKAASAGTREFYGIIYYSRLRNIPAVMVETGFVDTADALDFDSDIELQKWGRVMAEGIAAACFELKKAFVITIAGSGTRAEAEELLDKVKSAGFPADLKY